MSDFLDNLLNRLDFIARVVYDGGFFEYVYSYVCIFFIFNTPQPRQSPLALKSDFVDKN